MSTLAGVSALWGIVLVCFGLGMAVQAWLFTDKRGWARAALIAFSLILGAAMIAYGLGEDFTW